MSTPPTYRRDADGGVLFPMALVHAYDAIVARLYHRLRTEVRTSPEDETRGLPWENWLSRPNVPDVEIQGLTAAQAALVPGVRSVGVVTVTRGETLSVEVPVVLVLDGDPLGVSLVVSDPYQTSGPPLWFQTAG